MDVKKATDFICEIFMCCTVERFLQIVLKYYEMNYVRHSTKHCDKGIMGSDKVTDKYAVSTTNRISLQTQRP